MSTVSLVGYDAQAGEDTELRQLHNATDAEVSEAIVLEAHLGNIVTHVAVHDDQETWTVGDWITAYLATVP